jgi:UDP-glucose 4-epimerase
VILVSGATGFIGSAIVARLIASNVPVRRVVRNLVCGLADAEDTVNIGDLGPSTEWNHALTGVSVVIHTSARVHVMTDGVTDSLGEFRQANVAGTLHLANQAASMGVKRFIFLSSIKVNGGQTLCGQRYTPNDIPQPSDPYGISKREAEDGLRRVAEMTGMEVVIIRPVLVYGPGVKGNFLSMMRWLYKGIPLPLGGIQNARSLVALDNLVDLVVCCLDHPEAANQTLLVSDREDLSTTDLLRRTACAMKVEAKLFSAPAFIIKTGASLLGQGDVGLRLFGSLQVDITKTISLLGWSPPFTVDHSLKATAQYFLSNQAGYQGSL